MNVANENIMVIFDEVRCSFLFLDLVSLDSLSSNKHNIKGKVTVTVI